MKKISLLTVALIAGFAGVSKAEISQYTSAHISYAKTKVEDKNNEIMNKAAPALSVAYGLNFGKGLRSDVEFTYAFDAKKTEVKEHSDGSIENEKIKSNQMSLMLNGYYDIATGTKWTPYVNLGIGMTKEELKGSDDKGSDTTFTWQAGLGVSYEVANNFSVDAGYRYVDYGKVKDTDIKFDGEEKANMFSIGARYAF
ncbi:MAG: outer membrane protein [Alphaproteobacteria bacterium]